MRKIPYKTIGLGGSFDHLHSGHKALLDFAGNLGEKLSIGITTPEMVKGKHYSETIEPLRARKSAVAAYCRQKRYVCDIFTLYDVYGTTLDPEKSPQALAVTPETESGAVTINATRNKLGLRELPVFSCPLVFDQTGKQHIHSVRIRAGEISRRGELYSELFSQIVVLSDKQRQFFTTAQGPLVKTPSEGFSGIRMVVGDVVLEHFNTQKWQYSIGVFDTFSQREKRKAPTLETTDDLVSVNNNAGEITPELVAALSKLIQHKSGLLRVVGEEDLAAVAAVLLLPLESEVYYGQPNSGMVQLVVTESLKLSFFNTLTNVQPVR